MATNGSQLTWWRNFTRSFIKSFLQGHCRYQTNAMLNHNKPSATNHLCRGIKVTCGIHSHFRTEAQSSVMEKEVSLTAIKYSTQSAEQMVSKIKVIRPSSDPVAPVTDVGGLFNREGTKYLHSALQTGTSQSFKFLFVEWSHQRPVTENLSLQNGRSLCTEYWVQQHHF